MRAGPAVLGAGAAGAAAAAGLHAAAGAEGGHGVGGHGVLGVAEEVQGRVAVAGGVVAARQVQQVDAREDDEEAAEQADGVDGRGGVEAAEEDEGGDEGEGREGYVVERVDSAAALTARVAQACGGKGSVCVGGGVEAVLWLGWGAYRFVENCASALLK